MATRILEEIRPIDSLAALMMFSLLVATLYFVGRNGLSGKERRE